MNSISVIGEYGETFSSISNHFIDYYMTDANGEFVKIYLYLVRLMQAERSIQIQDIADHFECTQKDVCRAMRYWVDKGLLRLEFTQADELYGITILKVPAPKETKESERNSGLDLLQSSALKASSKVYSFPGKADVPETPDAKQPPEKKHLSTSQMQALEKDKEMESVLTQFEVYWGHTPTQAELQTLLYIYEQLEFPGDLLDYLIEYCAEAEHLSHRYMEKVAIDWYQRQIRTAKQAKEENAAYHALNSAISKELSLQRVLTKTELNYINKWKNEFGFDRDIILESCQRACAENKIKFSYINGILQSWYEQNIRTLDDVHRLDEKKRSARANAKIKNIPQNNFEQRGYEPEDLDNLFIREVSRNKKASEQ